MIFLTSVVTFLYIIYLGVMVSLKSKNDRLYPSFTGFLISLALWKLSDFFFLTVIGSTLTVSFGLKITYLGGILAPAFFLTLVFKLCQYSKRWIWLIYGSTAFFSATLFFSSLFIKTIFFIPQTLTLYIKTGVLYPYFLAEVALVLVSSMGILLYHKKKLLTEQREKITYFLVSVYFLAAAVVFYVLVMNKLLVYRFDTLFLFLFLSVLSFAMTKHNLADADMFITKLGSRGITVLCVMLSLILLKHFELYSSLSGIVTIAWCLSFEKVSRFIQTPLEKKFLKGSYNADDVVKYLATRLIQSETYLDVFQLLSQTIEDQIETKPLSFLCVSTDNEKFRFFHEGECLSLDLIDLEILSSLKSTLTPFYISELSGAVYETLLKVGCLDETYAIPISTPHGFRGLLFIHKKLNEDALSVKDTELLETLSKQVVNVLERIHHKVQLEKANIELEQKVATQVAEIESAMKMAEKSSKHASFGQLLMGIAHEIRNPLQAILGSVGLIEENMDDQEAVAMLVKSSMDNIHRLINIMETMLQYGKPSSGEKKDVLISTIVDDFLHLKEVNMQTRNIHLTRQYETKATVKADDNRVYQVVSNIITNAIEAMPEGGALTVRTFESDYMDKTNRKRAGVCFSVIDTGVGISDSEKENLFDTFFTTKYGNTGLGLPMVLQIIDDHEGMIAIDSEKGKGTTFNVFFPK